MTLVQYSHLDAYEGDRKKKMVIIVEDPEESCGIAPEDAMLRRYGSRPPSRYSFYEGARRVVKRFRVNDNSITVWFTPSFRPPRR